MPLADATGIFKHWTDTTNAERMNYWLSVLAENAMLVSEAIFEVNVTGDHGRGPCSHTNE